MASQTPAFEPNVVEAFIERLYRKASAVIVGCVATGVVLGAFVGATPLTSLKGLPIPAEFGYATLLVGCFVGGLVGYVVGETRSSIYRLQAQMALCDLETAKKVDRLVAFFFPETVAPPVPLIPQAAPPAPVAPAPAPAPAPALIPPVAPAPEPLPLAVAPAPEPLLAAPPAPAARPVPPLVVTAPLPEQPVTPPLSA
jgi:hypothetical protein